MTVTNARQATFFKQLTIGVLLTASSLSGGVVRAQKQGESKPGVAQRRFDSRGDPLPEGALLRIGTTRLQHEGDVWALAVSEDGRFLASFGADRAVRIWDAKDGRPLRRFDLPSWGPWAMAVSRDGKELKAVSFSADSKANGGFRHWEWATGRELSNRRDAPTTSQSVFHLALAHRENGELLAAGTSERDIFLFIPGASRSGKLLKGHTGRVMSVCI